MNQDQLRRAVEYWNTLEDSDLSYTELHHIETLTDFTSEILDGKWVRKEELEMNT